MKKVQAMLSLRQPSNRLALVAAAAVAPVMARAADGDIDVAPILAKITAAGTACAAIGIAYLIVVVSVKSYKMIKSAM